MEDSEIKERVIKLLGTDGKVKAIKYVRENSYRTLRESAAFVQHIEEELRTEKERDEDARYALILALLEDVRRRSGCAEIDVTRRGGNYTISISRIALFTFNENQTINYLQSMLYLLQSAI